MASFWEKVEIYDKAITIATLDRFFIAANYEVVTNDDNPDRSLTRFEYFELFLRIANAKFRETGVCETYS